MSQDLWSAVDKYIGDSLLPADSVLDAAVRESEAAGLPSIQVSPPQGKFLHILARSIGARRILEIGTLGGYSTIWLARALPGEGELVSIEVDPHHAEVAQRNVERAKLSSVVRIEVGDAREVLPGIASDAKAFDLIFIDADKASIPDYFQWSLKMSHPGSLIIVDNVVREGAVIDDKSEDAAVQGVRKLNEMMSQETRVISTVLQTVGSKGYDGLAVALVTGNRSTQRDS
jgi:predicted O-methyltransferase YrrM